MFVCILAVVGMIYAALIVSELEKQRAQATMNNKEAMSKTFYDCFNKKPPNNDVERAKMGPAIFEEIDQLVSYSETSFKEWNQKHYKVDLATYDHIMSSGVVLTLEKACQSSSYFGFYHPRCRSYLQP